MLAVPAHGGTVRQAARVGLGLRAAELVALALAGRVEVDRGRITVVDASRTDNRRLNNALAALEGPAAQATFAAWMGAAPPARRLLAQYLSLLADQGVLRFRQEGRGSTAQFVVELRDATRRAEAVQRLDHTVRARPDFTEPDDAAGLALAALVRACRLGPALYPGPFGLGARRRLARAVAAAADSGRAAVATTAAALTAEGPEPASDDLQIWRNRTAWLFSDDGLSQSTIDQAMQHPVEASYGSEHSGASGGGHDIGGGGHHGH